MLRGSAPTLDNFLPVAKIAFGITGFGGLDIRHGAKVGVYLKRPVLRIVIDLRGTTSTQQSKNGN